MHACAPNRRYAQHIVGGRHPLSSIKELRPRVRRNLPLAFFPSGSDTLYYRLCVSFYTDQQRLGHNSTRAKRKADENEDIEWRKATDMPKRTRLPVECMPAAAVLQRSLTVATHSFFMDRA